VLFDYQEGMGLMRRPESVLPCKRSFGQEPAKEMRMDMVAWTCHIFITEDKQSGANPFGNLRARKAEAGIRVHVQSSLQMEEDDGCPWPSHHQQNQKQSGG
jgi:hypothetical protein